MKGTTSREWVRQSLEHREPDRLPVEFGATPTSGMHVTCVAALRQHFGLQQRPVKVHEPYQMLGWIDEDLRDALGIDVDAVLKQRYGDRIVFWGGGVDTQKTLPFGTPEEVRVEVLERYEVFGRQGGFVFNSVHNVQARTPTANLVAMFDAVREFNGG